MSQTGWDGRTEDSSGNFWRPKGSRKGGAGRWRSAQRLGEVATRLEWELGQWQGSGGDPSLRIPGCQHLHAPEPFPPHSPGNCPALSTWLPRIKEVTGRQHLELGCLPTSPYSCRADRVFSATAKCHPYAHYSLKTLLMHLGIADFKFEHF